MRLPRHGRSAHSCWRSSPVAPLGKRFVVKAGCIAHDMHAEGERHPLTRSSFVIFNHQCATTCQPRFDRTHQLTFRGLIGSESKAKERGESPKISSSSPLHSTPLLHRRARTHLRNVIDSWTPVVSARDSTLAFACSPCPTVVISSASASGISIPNSSSMAMTTSTASSESSPRSEVNVAVAESCATDTPRQSPHMTGTGPPVRDALAAATAALRGGEKVTCLSVVDLLERLHHVHDPGGDVVFAQAGRGGVSPPRERHRGEEERLRSQLRLRLGAAEDRGEGGGAGGKGAESGEGGAVHPG